MRLEFEDFVRRATDEALALGLDAEDIAFREADLTTLHSVATYGLPVRYRHWTRGGAYQVLRLQHGLGLLRLYELVVHTRPPQAFLLRSNALGEQMGVAVHVMGHVDFFRHSAHLRGLGEEIADLALLHRRRIESYRRTYGEDRVEEILDRALILEAHAAADGAEDLLGVIERGGALLPWERDCISMVRSEALYFAALRRTKIINEGWATFWHLRLMRRMPVPECEFLDFLRMHVQVAEVGPEALRNPYALGLRLFEQAAAEAGTPFGEAPSGAALEELRLMREVEDDLAFVRNHLTPELARELAEGAADGAQTEESVGTVLRRIATSGRPLIRVEDADARGIRLIHVHDGTDLDLPEAEAVLGEIAALWGGPAELVTAVQGERLLLRHDGRSIVRVPL